MRQMGIGMLLKVIVIAGWAVVAAVSSASAQSLAGPAELPPSSFKGSQYVDSRGCVFLRAGIGGRVTWVPRISRDRKALCGPSPAAAARDLARAEAPVPAPPVVQRRTDRVAPPMETIASARRSAPAQVMLDGNDGYTPRRPAMSRSYAPDYTENDGYIPRRPAGAGPVTIPKGYKAAWADDRLNPNRGKGTARGQAQQDQIWSRDVPAQLITTATKRKTYATSSSNAPRTPQGIAGRFYVQVGTFEVAANATRTASKLQGLGLPVAQSRITSKGRQLQSVMAGPFRDGASAQAALSSVRRFGFGDAFIR